MKLAALFLALAAVATAAPALQNLPRDNTHDVAPAARGLLVKDGLLDGILGTVGGITGGSSGGAAGAADAVAGPIGVLLHEIIADVHNKVLPLLAGKPDSVVQQALKAIDDILGNLHIEGVPDLSPVLASLEATLNSILSDSGLVAKLLETVDAVLSSVFNGLKPIDTSSLNLAGLGGLQGVVGELVSLLNQLLSSILGGKALSVADLNNLTGKTDAVASSIKAGNAAGIDVNALTAILGPILQIADGLLSSVAPGDQTLVSARQGTVGSIATVLTGLAAVPAVDSALKQLLASLALQGPLAGVVSTVLNLLNALLGGLLGHLNLASLLSTVGNV